MHPRLSINTICSYNWTLEQDLALYREIGISHFGTMFPKIDGRVAESAAMIREGGFTVSCVGSSIAPVNAIEARRAGQADAVLEQLRSSIDGAAAIGSPLCYFPSGPTPSRSTTDEAIEALAELLAPAVAHAKSQGVRLAVENNSIASRHHGFVHTIADTVQLARDGDIDVVLELQQCWYEGNLPALFRENLPYFKLVQVSDFVVGEELKFNRRVMGDGDMPVEWMIGELLEAGYEGTFDIEVLGGSIEAEGYPSVVRRSIAWLDEALHRLGA